MDTKLKPAIEKPPIVAGTRFAETVVRAMGSLQECTESLRKFRSGEYEIRKTSFEEVSLLAVQTKAAISHIGYAVAEMKSMVYSSQLPQERIDGWEHWAARTNGITETYSRESNGYLIEIRSWFKPEQA